MAHLWRTDRTRSLAADLDVLVRKQRVLQDSLARLRTEAVALSSVKRIKRIATERIGLVEPSQPPVIVPAIEPLEDTDTIDGVRLWKPKAAVETGGG